MNLHRPFRALATGLMLFALPSAAQNVFAPEMFPDRFVERREVPDASLRNIRHVVCATFTEGAEPSLPVYERKADGFHPAGSIGKDETAPVSRWEDDEGVQEHCYPATQTDLPGGTTRYAEVIIDVYKGRKVWLREGGEAEGVWVTISSLQTLEAFESKRVELEALRRVGPGQESQSIVLRKLPDDTSPEVEAVVPVDIILRQRQGDFVEVYAYDEASGTFQPLGWMRIVDPSGLLLLWPGHFETHGC